MHKPKSRAYFRGGGCLLAALGGAWIKDLKAPCSVHWWGRWLQSRCCVGLGTSPPAIQLGEQSVFSAASLLRPHLEAHWHPPSSSHPADSLVAVVTRIPAPQGLALSGSRPAWLQTRALGAALLELGF